MCNSDMYFKHSKLCFTELSVIIILQCVVTLIGTIVCVREHTLDEAIVLICFPVAGKHINSTAYS